MSYAVNAAELSMAGDPYIGFSYDMMDCQEFIERCLADCGLSINLPGSNAWFRKMTWTGSPEECRKKFGCVPVGAFLFIHAFDGGEEARGYHDGLGNASHIGIKTGRGEGAVHSSQSREKVCQSKFKDKTIRGGWNMVGLWDQIDYGAQINHLLQNGQNQDNEVVITMSKATVRSSNGLGVNLRENTSKKSDLICNIPEGTVLDVTKKDAAWCRTTYGGRSGFVMSEFLLIEDNISIKVSRDTAKTFRDALNAALSDTEGVG